MRIVHVPTDLGMRGYSLSQAEQRLGHDSQVIVRMAGVHQSGAVAPLQTPNRLVSAWRWLRAMVRTLRADVVMANSGHSLVDFPTRSLHLLDLPVYKAMGKKVVVTFQGCDVRPCQGCPVRAALPEGVDCVNLPAGSTYDQFDELKAVRFARWSKYADAMLGITPDLCHTPGVRYSPHAKWVGEAADAVDRAERTPGTLRVAHMPRRLNKGTEWFEPRMREFCAEFQGRVEYVPITDMPWAQALRTLASCDVLVDQLIVGWYGGISVEAALLGTVPVAYIDPALLRYVEEPMRDDLPVLALSSREELFATLRALLDDPEALRAEAERCRRSALAYHDAQVVAEDLDRRYYATARGRRRPAAAAAAL
jgi:hypothetical protein